MPILLFRQPIFSVAQFLLRPLLPYLGLAVSSLPIYDAIFKFAQFTIRELGVIQTIQTLWNCRGYLVNRISLGVLSSILHAASPNLGLYFDEHVKDYLIRITRSGNKRLYIYIFNLLISLTLTVPIRLFLKLIIRKLILASFATFISLLTGTMSIFWIEPLRNIKSVLQFAWDVKYVLESYLPFNLPVPEGIKNLRELSIFSKLWYLITISAGSLAAYYLPTIIYDAAIFLDIRPFANNYTIGYPISLFPYTEQIIWVYFPFKWFYYNLIVPSVSYCWYFKSSNLYKYFTNQPSLVPDTYVFKYSNPIRASSSPRAGPSGIEPAPDDYSIESVNNVITNISKNEVMVNHHDIYVTFFNHLFHTMNVFI